MLFFQPNRSKYPRGIFVMFFWQLVSMIPYMFVTYLLILYASKSLLLPSRQAYSFTAAFIALTYSAHIFGGYISENYFGYKKATLIGILISTVGIFSLTLPIGQALHFISLSLFIVGSGMLVPCMFVLLGRLYTPNHSYRETGFILAYLGMNVGALLATFTAGFLLHYVGFKGVFLIGTMAQIILLVLFLKYQSVFNESSLRPQKKISNFSKLKNTAGYSLIFFSIVILAFLIKHSNFSNLLLITIGTISLLFILSQIIRLKSQARKNLIAFLVLTIIGLCFWAIYLMNTNVIIIFTEHNINRHIGNWVIPTATISAFSPFWIVILSPITTFILNKLLKKYQYKPSISLQFSIGLIAGGVGLLVLVVGILCPNNQHLVGLIWIILCYLFLTVGELLIAPVGFSMVGELVPAKFEALMIGFWELSVGISSVISGYFAKTTTPTTNTTNPAVTNLYYLHSFFWIGFIACIVGIIVLTNKRWLNRFSKTS